MKLVFTGIEETVDLLPGYVTVLQVENQNLFSRIARSLQMDAGDGAMEPFSVWDRDEEVRFESQSLVVTDPLNLPWDDCSLMKGVVCRIEQEFWEDEELRQRIEKMQQSFREELFELSLGLDSTYDFGAEWDFRRSLKAMGFGPAVQSGQSLIDNLMNFVSFALDSGCKSVLVFVNLKTFLTETDLKKLYEHVFYSRISLLLIENKFDGNRYEHEIKRVIDQDFLEY